MKTERELAELIFDKFREQKCETGQVILLKSIKYDKFIMNLNPIEKDLFCKVLDELKYTGYYVQEEDFGGILRLTEKGYQYIYDDEKISLMQNIPWIIPEKEKTNWDRAYNRLWKVVDNSIYYIKGSDFYKLIFNLYDNIPPSYNEYIEERRKKGISTSRVNYYKDLINLLDDDTRYQLYINIQIFIEDRILDKNDQDTNINISSNTSPFLDNLVGNTLSKKTEEKAFKEINNKKSFSNNENAPKVFISYSWDGEAHKNWVLNLATKLRKNGIDAILDQWELELGKPIPSFMGKSIEISDRVICIMTPSYKTKSNAEKPKGGVAYESSIMAAETIKNISTTKFIPLLREGNDNNAIPDFLIGRTYIDMRNDNSFEDRLEELLRNIYNEPKDKKPPIGKKPEYVENKNKEKNIEIELSVLKEDISLNSILSGRFYDIHINISNIRERGSIEKLQCFVSMDNKLRQCIHYSTQIQKINNNIIQVYFENSNIINGIVISYNPILPSVKRDIGILKVKKSFFDQHLLINFQVSTEFGSEEFSFFADEILY